MSLLMSWFFGRREVRGESERRGGWRWRSFAPLGALTLWGVADAPRAEGLDMASLEVMLEEEIVRVEAVMGRQVLETPTLRAATFEEFVSTYMVTARLNDPRLATDPQAYTATELALREEHASERPTGCRFLRSNFAKTQPEFDGMISRSWAFVLMALSSITFQNSRHSSA